MLYSPHFNPIAFHIIGFPVHWYGMMYLISFVVGGFLACYRKKTAFPSWSNDVIIDLLFYVVLGVIIGGRLGYVLFYNLLYYWYHPGMIFAVWDGGMSFHGGLLGVILASYIWARKKKCSLWAVTDFIAPIVPIGLAAGRIGNFINGELWGRVTTMPWGMVFPNAGPYPRHPSQLYEFFLEGVVLFIIMWLFSRKKRPKMATSGLFLLLYGCLRFICEFFRNPDPQLGFVAFGWLTRGQELSVPMIVLGAWLIFIAYYQTKGGTDSSQPSIEKTMNHDDSKGEV